MDRNFNVVQAAAAAGPVAFTPFEIGASDADHALEVELSASGGTFILFAGSLSTAECNGILAQSGANVDQIICAAASGGRVEARIPDGTRQLTVYSQTNAPAVAAIATVRVQACKR